MDSRIAKLKDHHLVFETNLSRLLSFSHKELEENIMKKIYDTLEIKIGKNIYEIILKPFYDNYHGSWVHDDFQSFSEYIEDTEIYIVIVKPGYWNDFKLILSRIKQLSEDIKIDCSEDIFYVNIPFTLPMHRW